MQRAGIGRKRHYDERGIERMTASPLRAASHAVSDHPAIRSWRRTTRDALPLALWSAPILQRRLGGTASGDFQCSGVEMDSRDVRPGDLFVALKGEAMDGHKFVDKAFAAGAAAAIVDRPVDGPHILVSDTTDALHALAHAARDRAYAKRIAVTGSVGKTGVKEAIFCRARPVEPRPGAPLGPQLQQPCGCSAQSCADAGAQPLRYFRDGHEPCRRDRRV